MSYTPTNWKAGDTVTSAKLNKIEQGIASAGGANILVANGILDSSNTSGGTRSAANAPMRLDKTFGEIFNADFVIVQMIQNDTLRRGFIAEIQHIRDQIFGIMALIGIEPVYFIAQGESDYPTLDIDDSGNDSGDDSGNTPIAT